VSIAQPTAGGPLTFFSQTATCRTHPTQIPRNGHFPASPHRTAPLRTALSLSLTFRPPNA